MIILQGCAVSRPLIFIIKMDLTKGQATLRMLYNEGHVKLVTHRAFLIILSASSAQSALALMIQRCIVKDWLRATTIQRGYFQEITGFAYIVIIKARDDTFYECITRVK